MSTLSQQTRSILGTPAPAPAPAPAPKVEVVPPAPLDRRGRPKRLDKKKTILAMMAKTAVWQRTDFARAQTPALQPNCQTWEDAAIRAFCHRYKIDPIWIGDELVLGRQNDAPVATGEVSMAEVDRVARAAAKEMIDGMRVELPFEKIKAAIRLELEMQTAPRAIEVRMPDKAPVVLEEAMHGMLPMVLQLAAASKPILLIGPAGSGKTYLAGQLARSLRRRFGSVSCSMGMSEGILGGRLLPVGEAGRFEYLASQFVDFYENGGVFLLDEVDAADANTLLVLNQALAGKEMPVPNRVAAPMAKRHPDFLCIAAANTYGTGADRLYVGRNQLDEAFLDRFRMGQLELDYDAALERKLCPDAVLRERWQAIRAKVEQNRLRRVVSMRSMQDAYDMRRVGWTLEQCIEQLVAGWSGDERTKVGLTAKKPGAR